MKSLCKDGAVITVDDRAVSEHLALGWQLAAVETVPLADYLALQQEVTHWQRHCEAGEKTYLLLEKENQKLTQHIAELEAQLAGKTVSAEKMKVDEIKARLTELGVDIPADAKKPDLLALLEEAEAGNQTGGGQ